LSNVDAPQQHAMMMAMNCHTITFVEDRTAHPLMCCHKVQPQQTVDCLADPVASPTQEMLMLLNDKQ
jgi:hypothetical protein